MDTAHAKQPVTKCQSSGQKPARVLDVAHARAVYLESKSHLDLATLASTFATAPDAVETSGRVAKPLRR